MKKVKLITGILKLFLPWIFTFQQQRVTTGGLTNPPTQPNLTQPLSTHFHEYEPRFQYGYNQGRLKTLNIYFQISLNNYDKARFDINIFHFFLPVGI